LRKSETGTKGVRYFFNLHNTYLRLLILPIYTFNSKCSVPKLCPQNLVSAKEIRIFPLFMEIEGELPCSQGPTTVFHPKSDESSPHMISSINILILSCQLRLGLQSSLFSCHLAITKIYVFLIPQMRSTSSTHSLSLAMTTLDVFILNAKQLTYSEHLTQIVL
jgi:hypothetical protein